MPMTKFPNTSRKLSGRYVLRAFHPTYEKQIKKITDENTTYTTNIQLVTGNGGV